MRNIVLGGLVVLAATACLDQREYADPSVRNQPFGDAQGPTGNLQLQNAFLKGDIGPVTGLDGPATVDGNDDPSWGTSINMTSQTNSGSGLVILQLDKSLHALPTGTTHMTGGNDMSQSSYVQLCSDTAGGGTHFDGIAKDVDIVIQDHPQGRDVDITATIDEGFDGPSAPTTVNSHFTMSR